MTALMYNFQECSLTFLEFVLFTQYISQIKHEGGIITVLQSFFTNSFCFFG